MQRLRMNKRSMALSMLLALAMTMLFAVIMDSRTSIAATTSGQVVQINKIDEASMVSSFWDKIAKLLRKIICYATTPPIHWDRC